MDIIYGKNIKNLLLIFELGRTKDLYKIILSKTGVLLIFPCYVMFPNYFEKY